MRTRGRSATNLARWLQAGSNYRPCLKSTLALLFLFGSIVWLPATASITLVWPQNPDPTIEGYNVYSGNTSHVYTSVTDVGNVTSAVIGNLQEGRTYYFSVTAYDSIGLESLPSPERVYAVPYVTNLVKFSSSPITVQTNGQVRVDLVGPVGRTAVLQTSTNMTAWQSVATNVFASTNLYIKYMDTPGGSRVRFYRVMLQ